MVGLASGVNVRWGDFVSDSLKTTEPANHAFLFVLMVFDCFYCWKEGRQVFLCLSNLRWFKYRLGGHFVPEHISSCHFENKDFDDRGKYFNGNGHDFRIPCPISIGWVGHIIIEVVPSPNDHCNLGDDDQVWGELAFDKVKWSLFRPGKLCGNKVKVNFQFM